MTEKLVDTIVVDWKERPDDVVEQVNKALANGNSPLRFVEQKDTSDTYTFNLYVCY